MAPLQQNRNVLNNARQEPDRRERDIQEYLEDYVDLHYTEEMYMEQVDNMFEILHNRYNIQAPEIAVIRVHSFRAVLAEYAHIIPLFELEGFGM